MSHVFAYLRVSTDAQDVANQKLGVVRYCTEPQLLAAGSGVESEKSMRS